MAPLDVSGLDPRLAAVTFRIAVDVQNPLYGSDGAAHVFGPQKGADEDAMELLDAGLRNWASVLRESTGRDVNVPGAGAAGGFPASFLAFSNAALEGGFELVAGLTGLAGKLGAGGPGDHRRGLAGFAVADRQGADCARRCRPRAWASR